MYISLKKAINEIVSEISEITGHDTNFIDVDGQIIASTNANRIGNIHHGAQKIIAENLDELYIPLQDEDSGTKAGLNLPIFVFDKIFGIIGITGYYEEVFPYARLVKRITEILLADSMQKQIDMDREKLKQDFLHTWILDEGVAEGEIFNNRAQLLDIDLKKLRRILIVYYEDNNGNSTKDRQMLIIKINQKIQYFFEKFNDTYALIGNNIIYVALPASKNKQILNLSQSLLQELKEYTEFDFYIGIDGSESGSSVLSIPLLQAKQSYKAAILNKQSIFLTKILELNFLLKIPALIRKEITYTNFFLQKLKTLFRIL